MKSQKDIGEKLKKIKKIRRETKELRMVKNIFKKSVEKKFGISKKDKKKEEENFTPPAWWDCGWKRVPCGKSDCPICKKEMARQVKNVMNGKEPDDLESVFEEMVADLEELKEMIKKDAERFGIEIEKIEVSETPPFEMPEEKSPLYKEISAWRKKIYDILDSMQLNNDLWVYTEEAADLAWYANTFLSKTVRQLSTLAEKEAGLDFLEFDYEYTRGVLLECSGIIKKSLGSLYKGRKFSREDLNFLDREFLELEEKVLKI